MKREPSREPPRGGLAASKWLTARSKQRIEIFFSRLRALLWRVFEVLLLLLAMAAVVEFAVRHIPPRALPLERPSISMSAP